LGAFLVGAYQETLGDLHNLLGDTHVASIRLEDGELSFAAEIAGDSISDVLSYVEYDPKDLAVQFRELAERAVKQRKISATERREIMDAYDSALRGYTYFRD
jgi:arginine decarboxylase